MKLSKLKTFSFALSAVILFFMIIEVSLRALYFQQADIEPLCIIKACKKIRKDHLRRRAEKEISQTEFNKDNLRFIYSEPGKELLAELQRDYETEFAKLHQELAGHNVHPVMLYHPHHDYWSPHLPNSRDFFKHLADKFGVDFVDLTDALFVYEPEVFSLLPEDRHLSRFGNQIVAKNLSEYLKRFKDRRSSLKFDRRPKLFGDQKPNFHDLSPWDTERPYMLTTNSQGLRMTYDLTFPKTRQRILILGDSYTFGPYLENAHTFPAILEKTLGYAEVINAGHGGYTISHEASLYFERAQYTEPDIVVLQVLDNDVWGLMYFHENKYNRHGESRKPTPAEISFLEKIKNLR